VRTFFPFSIKGWTLEDKRPVRLAGGRWLVLICSERKVLLADCWWLVCCERKVLLADKPNKQSEDPRGVFDRKKETKQSFFMKSRGMSHIALDRESETRELARLDST
jgi:hypothetical protein